MRLFPVILVCLALVNVAVPRAAEPDGFVHLVPGWQDDARGLTFRIQPVVPLSEARLLLILPDAVTMRPRTPSASTWREVSSRPGQRSLVLDMGAVASGVLLDFEVDAPPGKRGIATFLVVGRTVDGRSFSEGIGIALGKADPDEPVRDGAIEYPSATPGGGR